MLFGIIEPSVKFFDPYINGINLLKKVEAIGRTSHATEDRQTEDSWKRFILDVIMKKGDLSILQHVHITVEFICDRGVADEFLRHRIAAYTVKSTRFVNYAKINTETEELINPPEFICPPSIAENPLDFNVWCHNREQNIVEYNYYIDQGYPPEIARNCLPFSIATRMIATYNLHMWRYFFLMRTSRNAHPQARLLATELLKQFQQCIPIIYDDIEPGKSQAFNLKLLH